MVLRGFRAGEQQKLLFILNIFKRLTIEEENPRRGHGKCSHFVLGQIWSGSNHIFFITL